MWTMEQWSTFWREIGQHHAQWPVTPAIEQQVKELLTPHMPQEEWDRRIGWVEYEVGRGVFRLDVPQPGDVLTPLPKYEPVEAMPVDRRTSQKGL